MQYLPAREIPDSEKGFPKMGIKGTFRSYFWRNNERYSLPVSSDADIPTTSCMERILLKAQE